MLPTQKIRILQNMNRLVRFNILSCVVVWRLFAVLHFFLQLITQKPNNQNTRYRSETNHDNKWNRFDPTKEQEKVIVNIVILPILRLDQAYPGMPLNQAQFWLNLMSIWRKLANSWHHMQSTFEAKVGGGENKAFTFWRIFFW